MTDLIARLTELIIQDNVVLFIGNYLQPQPDAKPEMQAIAETLANLINYTRPDRSLAAVARDFELLQGRAALIMALRDELQKQNSTPNPLTQLIADAVAPNTKVITTRIDQTLEQALTQFEKPYVLIVRDTDVPFFDESKITLIKMQGDINQPDSLVITEDDMEAFINRLPTVSDVVKAFFATKTLIFLGYNLGSDLFKRLYLQVTRNLNSFQRQAYAISPHTLDDIDTRYWQSHSMTIHTELPLSFLEKLANSIKSNLKTTTASPNPLLTLKPPTLPARPYKALESFTAADENIFNSRLEESYRLTNRILAHRVTVLYGQSGSGKSSLLQAGVGPRLSRNRALLILCQPIPGQPFPRLLRQALEQTGAEAGLPPPQTESLAALIRQWQRILEAPIVLGLDQFEQFFLAYTPQEQATVTSFLADLLNDRSLDIRLILVLREDFLGHLDSLQTDLPSLLDMRFRLNRLDREAARAAIEEPARLFNIAWESSLVQKLLDELIAVEGQQIAPPQLQLVCDYLYQNLIDNLPAGASEEERIITLAQFEALGGTEAILGHHLERVLQTFSATTQPIVQTLLGALVSSVGVKQRLSLTVLSQIANTSPAIAAPILNHLTDHRLLQRYQVKSEDSDISSLEYELTHDYLVTRISDWLGTDFWAAQKVRELIRQALTEWQTRNRLLPAADFNLVKMHRTRLSFTPPEFELLYAAAISYKEPAIQDWHFQLSKQQQEQILLKLVQNDKARIRRRAIRQLGTFNTPESVQALVQAALYDSDDTVQQAATESIARANAQLTAKERSQQTADSPSVINKAALSQLISATSNPATTDTALNKLILIRDWQPASQTLMPQALQASLHRKAWQNRWQRNKTHILQQVVQGVNAGYWALALVTGPFWGLFLGLSGAGFRTEVPFRIVLASLMLGLTLTGMLGALTGGLSAFTQVLLQCLPDYEHPKRTWLLTTLSGALSFGLGFLALSYIVLSSPNSFQPSLSFLAGLLISLGFIGAATLPLNKAWYIRLGLTIVVSIIVFNIVGLLGWAFNDNVVWLSILGAGTGLGFFVGLNQKIKN